MKQEKIRSAIYARVSTILQEYPQTQLTACSSYSSSRSFEVFKEYVDHGISGRREKRPALDQLLQDARSGKFQVIVITALDRIGRDTRHLLNLLNELDGYGVRVISLRENLDMTTPMGKVMLTITSAVAELEVNLTRDRIRTALAAKKLAAAQTNNGWRCGRPSLSPEITPKVLELVSAGESYSAISKKLGVSKASISRIVKNCRNRTVSKT